MLVIARRRLIPPRVCAQRGIDVMLEIDTPGHTSVISKSHPEHVACFVSSPWSTFANGEVYALFSK